MFEWIGFRFHADNLGYWLIHCHMSWHNHIGMALILKVMFCWCFVATLVFGFAQIWHHLLEINWNVKLILNYRNQSYSNSNIRRSVNWFSNVFTSIVHTELLRNTNRMYESFTDNNMNRYRKIVSTLPICLCQYV